MQAFLLARLGQFNSIAVRGPEYEREKSKSSIQLSISDHLQKLNNIGGSKKIKTQEQLDKAIMVKILLCVFT